MKVIFNSIAVKNDYENVVRMYGCDCFPTDQIKARSRRRISVPPNTIQTIDEINPLFHYLLFEFHPKMPRLKCC